MELALYHPDRGYYARGSGRIGPRGDFYTASDVGTAFGECIARQLAEMDRLLGSPDPFGVVEFGAGRGLLVRDLLDAVPSVAPELAGRLHCLLVDRSPAMREEARRRVPEASVLAPEERPVTDKGCVIAVELFDALPVHRVRRRGNDLVEVYVDLDPDLNLVECEGEADPEVLAIARRYGAAPRDGDEAEVSPESLALLDLLQVGLRSGFIVVVDYGRSAAELYVEPHRRGTLLAYHRHRASEDYLLRVGEQDLTAHVNFSALEDRARGSGLEVLGRTTQDRFLIANGIIERFTDSANLADRHDPWRVKQRLQAMQLIHPHSMGRRFHVLILAKNVSPRPGLTGLTDPFAR